MRLDWAGLDCIELGWAGTDWAEVGWGGLHGGRMLCQWVPISRGAPRILDTSRSCGLPGTQLHKQCKHRAQKAPMTLPRVDVKKARRNRSFTHSQSCQRTDD